MKEIQFLLKARDAAFGSGDSLALKVARRELTAGVKKAQAAFAQRIQGHFMSNDPRSMWRGIKCITDYNNMNNAQMIPLCPTHSTTFTPAMRTQTPPSATDSPLRQKRSLSV